jgi:hypothetical protein
MSGMGLQFQAGAARGAFDHAGTAAVNGDPRFVDEDDGRRRALPVQPT